MRRGNGGVVVWRMCEGACLQRELRVEWRVLLCFWRSRLSLLLGEAPEFWAAYGARIYPLSLR